MTGIIRKRCLLLGDAGLTMMLYLRHMKHYKLILIVLSLIACNRKAVQDEQTIKQPESVPVTMPSLVILGIVQDAGSPHIGCEKECCSTLFANLDPSRMVVSLGIIDPQNKRTFLVEATPDITQQLHLLRKFTTFKNDDVPDGIFLTHAHIGHYAGLMYLGREALGAKGVSVYAMPRMKSFLENNGPWNQLVELENITLNPIQADTPVVLSSSITVTPFRVPHRDEFSETVGYVIEGPEKKALFIPDIDKWDKWERSIVDEIKTVDYAFLDATFYDGAEINNRDINEIPHPFVIESLEVFKNLPAEEKSKIYFIHFNHTNPLLIPDSEQAKKVREAGYGIARTGSVFRL
jgi:pyrroloquinoline quinone biosynthesis protein B